MKRFDILDGLINFKVPITEVNMKDEYKIYNYDLKEYVLGSIIVAYHYDLFPELCGITLDWNKSEIAVIFYIDVEVNDEISETISEIETYFKCALSEHTYGSEVKTIKSFAEMKCLREWTYLRYDLKDNEHFKK